MGNRDLAGGKVEYEHSSTQQHVDGLTAESAERVS